MSKKLISSSILSAIADFIRSKKGTQDTYKPTEFVEEINEVYDDKQPVLQSKSATPSTSAQVIEADNGYDGLEQVNISAIQLQEKTVTPSLSYQDITPDAGKDGLSKVRVNKMNLHYGEVKSRRNQNYYYYPTSEYDGFDYIFVQMDPVNSQNKTVTPTTSAQVITADLSYDALGEVTINAVTAAIDPHIIPSNIKDGVTILGVVGTYTGGGQVTSNSLNNLLICNATEIFADDLLGVTELTPYFMSHLFSFTFQNTGSQQWISKINYITLPSTITHIDSYNFDMSLYNSNGTGKYFYNFNQYQLYYDGTVVQYASIQKDETISWYRNIPTRFASAFYILDSSGTVTRNNKTYSLLRNINISGTNVTVKTFAFAQMPNEISSITIGSGVVAIEDYAFHRIVFAYDSSLQNRIYINSSGLTIGKGAFACGIPVNDPEVNRHFGSYNYNRVNIIEIADCASIGDYAFANFKTLTRIIIRKTDAVITAGTEIFYGWDIPETMSYDDFHIYVPAALVDSYKAASGWRTYASYITALPNNI